MPRVRSDPSGPGVVVVGAGVVGLTSAVCLAEAGHRVEVWTADDPAGTTSAAGGAVWKPTTHAPLPTALRWAERSLHDLCALTHDRTSGVRQIEAVTLTPLEDDGPPSPLLRYDPNLTSCRADELPPGHRHGYRSTVPVIDVPVFTDWLVRRLRVFGGEVVRRRIDTLDEAAGAAPVVVNAAGREAGGLADDPSVQPLFSQYVVLENPGLHRLVHVSGLPHQGLSIIPHADRVHLGGVRTPGRTDPRPDPVAMTDVLQRAREVEPLLEDAAVLRVDTGILGARPTLRVDVERRGRTVVVHDYGHGAAGMTLAWGAAHQVAELVAREVATS